MAQVAHLASEEAKKASEYELKITTGSGKTEVRHKVTFTDSDTHFIGKG